METGLQTLRALSCCHPAFRPWQEIWDGQICQTLAPNPQAAPRNPTDVCLCLFRFDRMLLCVCACMWSVCMCLQDSMLDQIPLPQAWSRVHYHWAIEGRSPPVILFLSHPSDLFLFLWYVKSVQWGKNSASIAPPRCVSSSNSSFSIFIPLSLVHW